METEPVSAAITVRMTRSALFDFYLYHAYSKFSGFLTNILGLAVFFLGVFSYASGKISASGCAVFVIASIGFLGFTPLQLRRKADREMRGGRAGSGPIEMIFTDGRGIDVEQGGERTFYSWENVRRASVTPKTIAVYVNEEEALIIPKQDFGDKFVLCYQIIAKNLSASRFTGR
ncbi:MAG: YcxB family protein [Lachnospiraceae bacterium]|nr:YcxB family protein [Lachnospiraceae bacterium]